MSEFIECPVSVDIESFCLPLRYFALDTLSNTPIKLLWEVYWSGFNHWSKDIQFWVGIECHLSKIDFHQFDEHALTFFHSLLALYWDSCSLTLSRTFLTAHVNFIVDGKCLLILWESNE